MSSNPASPQPRIRQRPRPAPAISAPAVPEPAPLPTTPSDPVPPPPSEPSYAVGYGRPPTHSRFRPGRSGNPRGRPRGAKGIKTIVREQLTAKISVGTPTGQKSMSVMEAVLLKAAQCALQGDMRASAQVIQHYSAAVPEAPPASSQAPSEQELSATDQAILEAFRTQCREDAGGKE